MNVPGDLGDVGVVVAVFCEGEGGVEDFGGHFWGFFSRGLGWEGGRWNVWEMMFLGLV